MVNTTAVRRSLPGLGVLLALGLLAREATAFLPVGSRLLVVIGLGVIVANTVGVPGWAEPGVGTYGRWLEFGIVLMGATVGLERVLAAGRRVILVVGLAVLASVLTVETLSRTVFGIPEKAGSLLAAGSGVCGVSAITAVAGAIDPDGREVAYAAATVLLFDAVTLAVYPAVARVLALSDVVFGLWAGATMFSTGPATAAGFAHSRTAGEWAVLVKLARNALIGAVAIGYALYYARRGTTATTVGSKPLYLWRTFPKFVLGFLLLLALRGTGVLSGGQAAALGRASDWAFLVAFAGLGLGIDLREFRAMGVRPVGVVLTSLSLVGTGVLLLLLVLF
ncbi:putative sulfate exporter family transporter [Halobacteriales archaeon QS_5_70_15]|nr:MAG: putative sulfate exporter family transporter [Halobacteriales archaeon QS_5_70_15]